MINDPTLVLPPVASYRKLMILRISLRSKIRGPDTPKVIPSILSRRRDAVSIGVLSQDRCWNVGSVCCVCPTPKICQGIWQACTACSKKRWSHESSHMRCLSGE